MTDYRARAEGKRLAIAFDSEGHPRLALGDTHPEYAKRGGHRVDVVPADRLQGAVEDRAALTTALANAATALEECGQNRSAASARTIIAAHGGQ